MLILSIISKVIYIQKIRERERQRISLFLPAMEEHPICLVPRKLPIAPATGVIPPRDPTMARVTQGPRWFGFQLQTWN